MPTESMSGEVSLPNVPKPDNLAIMLEAALTERAKLAEELKRLDTIVNSLVGFRSGGDRGLAPVKPNEYQGMRAVDALETYLRARRGSKISLSKAVSDLVAGGVDPGHSRGRKTDPKALVAHTLRISLPNKHEIFSWTPTDVSTKTGLTIIKKGIPDDQILVELAASADTPKRRKRTK